MGAWTGVQTVGRSACRWRCGAVAPGGGRRGQLLRMRAAALRHQLQELPIALPLQCTQKGSLNN